MPRSPDLTIFVMVDNDNSNNDDNTDTLPIVHVHGVMRELIHF